MFLGKYDQHQRSKGRHNTWGTPHDGPHHNSPLLSVVYITPTCVGMLPLVFPFPLLFYIYKYTCFLFPFSFLLHLLTFSHNINPQHIERYLVSMATLQRIQVQLSGGCELLFQSPTLTLEKVVPAGATAGELVALLRERYVLDRPELFTDAQGTSPRPGILTLVNGCDVEIYGGMNYALVDGDTVDFISTLHGG
eukprot:gene7308-5150_t